jgi:hypothetical protein
VKPNAHTYRADAPEILHAKATLCRLAVGEVRENGDYWLNCFNYLHPVTDLKPRRWWRRNRVTKWHCPHYRLVSIRPDKPITPEPADKPII